MYIVEGNIGAGKSTFLTLIEKHLPQFTVALEPLNNWQKQVYGQSLLANFYEDTRRWAYTLETLTMICRVREHLAEQKNNDPYRLMERSIYSGHYCFAKNGFQNGFLTPLEWEIYSAWFATLIPGKCLPPRGFIYLQVTPEVSYERIKKRNRLAEKNISLKYLKQIYECHENFLIHKTDVIDEIKNVPVLVLNCNQEFESDPEYLKELLHKVELFISTHSVPVSIIPEGYTQIELQQKEYTQQERP